VAALEGGAGLYRLSGVPAGDYVVSGTLSDWDGSPSASGIELSIRPDFSAAATVTITASGAFTTSPISVSGTLDFLSLTQGAGCRVDNFVIEAA
jgi:hypothetical protein